MFLGLNEMTGELMAVKQIKMSQAGDERAMHIASLEREIVLYRKMRHRHIVAYIDMERDEDDGSLYVFLEFVSGGSIHRYTRKSLYSSDVYSTCLCTMAGLSGGCIYRYAGVYLQKKPSAHRWGFVDG